MTSVNLRPVVPGPGDLTVCHRAEDIDPSRSSTTTDRAGRSSLRLDHRPGAPAAEDQRDHEQHDEDEEEDPGELHQGALEAEEAEGPGDQREDQERECPA